MLSFGIEKPFDFPFTELWYELKFLWSKDGFIEWLESMNTTYDRLQSILHTRKSPFYVCLMIPPMIYFTNFLFLARGLSCTTQLVTLVDVIAVHSGSVMTSIFLIKNLSILITPM
jgi:hypothetical protein